MIFLTIRKEIRWSVIVDFEHNSTSHSVIPLSKCLLQFCSKESEVKSVHIRSFSGLYFPIFTLNMKIYSVNIRIHSEYGKKRTRKILTTDTFYLVFIIDFEYVFCHMKLFHLLTSNFGKSSLLTILEFSYNFV